MVWPAAGKPELLRNPHGLAVADRSSHGLIKRTLAPSKSAIFRVARVNSCCKVIVITSPKQLFPKGYVQGGDREYLSMLRSVILNLSPAELSQLTVALWPIQTVLR